MSFVISMLTQRLAYVNLVRFLVSLLIEISSSMLLVIPAITLICQYYGGRFGGLIQVGIRLIFFISGLNPLYHFFKTNPFFRRNHGPNSITLSISSSHAKLKDRNSLCRAINLTWSLFFQFFVIHLMIISILVQNSTHLLINIFFNLSTFKSMLPLVMVNLTFLSLISRLILNFTSSLHSPRSLANKFIQTFQAWTSSFYLALWIPSCNSYLLIFISFAIHYFYIISLQTLYLEFTCSIILCLYHFHNLLILL